VSLILFAVFVFSVAAITPLAYVSWRFVERAAMSMRSSPVWARMNDRPGISGAGVT
jgi:peptidoglycan/LPS O-acetylase OafA/YrhL